MQNNQFLKKALLYFFLVAIFILDLFTKLGFAVGILYVLPLFFLSFLEKKLQFTLVSSLTIFLTLFVFFIRGGDIIRLEVAFDRIVSVLVITVSSILLLRRKTLLLKTKLRVNSLEQQAKVIIEQIDDYSILFLDKDGKVKNWNNGSKRIFGFDEKEVIGKSFERFFTQKTIEKNGVQKLLDDALKNGNLKDEGWLKKVDNSIFWSELNLKPLFKNDKELIGYSLIIQNIDEMRNYQHLLEATNDIAKVGGWQIDLLKNEMTWTKNTFIIHEMPNEIVPPLEEGINFYLEGEDRERIKRVFNRVVEEGIPYEEVLRIKTYKGNIKWVKTKAYPILIDSKCVKVYGSFQDINEEKKREIELYKNEQRFKKVFDYSPNGMVVVNKDGGLSRLNKRAVDIFGYPEEELLKMTFQEITFPADLNKDLELFKQLDSGEIEFYEIEKRYIQKSGAIVWANLAVSRILDENNETDYFISQITDINERKRADKKLKVYTEKLLTTNQELEQFAYIASHDLQEPLRTISSFGQLLSKSFEGQLDDKKQKYLDFIMDASERMRIQVKGLLEYNRLGRSSERIKEIINVEEIIEEVKEELGILIKETNATVSYTELPIIKGYRTEFKLLFQNLINNSIKFRRKGERPLIEILSSENKGFWEFAVKDNGIGIKEEFQTKVFQIFQRLHSRREFEGSGIGLAHASKIILLHGGKVWIESEYGEGTTLRFTIKKKG